MRFCKLQDHSQIHFFFKSTSAACLLYTNKKTHWVPRQYAPYLRKGRPWCDVKISPCGSSISQNSQTSTDTVDTCMQISPVVAETQNAFPSSYAPCTDPAQGIPCRSLDKCSRENLATVYSLRLSSVDYRENAETSSCVVPELPLM